MQTPFINNLRLKRLCEYLSSQILFTLIVEVVAWGKFEIWLSLTKLFRKLIFIINFNGNCLLKIISNSTKVNSRKLAKEFSILIMNIEFCYNFRVFLCLV
jgi:hypothetical protein